MPQSCARICDSSLLKGPLGKERQQLDKVMIIEGIK